MKLVLKIIILLFNILIITSCNLGPFSGQLCGVSSIAFSTDNNKIVIGEGNGNVSMWNESLLYRKTFLAKGGHLNNISWNNKGTTFIILLSSLNYGGTSFLNFYNKNGNLLKSIKFNYYINEAHYSDFNDNIILLLPKGYIIYIDSDGKLINKIKAHNDEIINISFSIKKNKYLTCSKDNTIKIWSIEGKLLQTINELINIQYAAFTNTDNNIIYGTEKGILKLLDLENSTYLLQINNAYHNRLLNLKFNPDGNSFITMSSESSNYKSVVKLWSKEGILIKILNENQHLYPSTVLEYSPKGDKIFSGDANFNIIIWNSKGNYIKRIGYPYFITNYLQTFWGPCL